MRPTWAVNPPSERLDGDSADGGQSRDDRAEDEGGVTDALLNEARQVGQRDCGGAEDPRREGRDDPLEARIAQLTEAAPDARSASACDRLRRQQNERYSRGRQYE